MVKKNYFKLKKEKPATWSLTKLWTFLLLFGLLMINSQQTYAQDTDGDSILDNVDLDDDNDGILDVNEDFCVGFTEITYSDLGLSDNTFNQSATNIDLSSSFNIPSGSILISIRNANLTNGIFKVGNDNSTTFTVSGTYPVKIQVAHGPVLKVDITDGIISDDGVIYTQIQALDAGIVENIAGNAYTVENPTDSNITNTAGDFTWVSDHHATQVTATSTPVNTVASVYFYICPAIDTDGDNSDLIEAEQDYTAVDTNNDGVIDSADCRNIIIN